jgi:TPR repeat protein
MIYGKLLKRIIAALICVAFECIAGNAFISNYVFEWSYKDPKVVERYLRSSVMGPAPNPVAAYLLGLLYIEGGLLKKNLKMADCFLTMAANAGLPEAINAIGDSYYTGDTREKNVRMALRYYEKAANMGFGPAQFNAGVVLLRIATGKHDLRKAILYLDKAAKNSNDLGEMTKSVMQHRRNAEDRLKKYM